MFLLKNLVRDRLINPPPWLPQSTQYLCLMGSVAYGVAADDSDADIYGFCIPKKDMIFPHLRGEILGFGKQINRFEQWQQHHVKDEKKGKEYDFQIYSIVKFFQLCMENNPNMVDALFVPQRCVIYCSPVGQLVRENRKIFLHRGCWHKFKGYAYSQLHKIKTKRPQQDSKRYKDIQQYGFDCKFAYHVVRLINEVEQILTEKNLNLERDREILKAIRRGEWTEEKITRYFEQKEEQLKNVYHKSDLPYGPQEDKIKKLLIECLECYFGNLDEVIHMEKIERTAIEEISKICNKILTQ